MMKKKYVTPNSITINVAAKSMIAGSLDVENTPQNGLNGDAKFRTDDYLDYFDWDN